VVIETTGLADPGPVAQTFFMDDEIAESYLLDSILTLVDAKHADQQLDDRQEARRQVGFADQIFISKTDLVSQDEDALHHRLKHMNPRAPQQGGALRRGAARRGVRPAGFNLNAKLDIDPDFLDEKTITAMTTTMTTPWRALRPSIARRALRPPASPPPRRRREELRLRSRPRPSTRPSWKTSWAPSSRSTARACCATRAC
jgi:hypothetical protein